jgi:uncharacterized membrane protein HdeD (DUF308 family)
MHEEMWHKGKGIAMLVLGLLIIANIYWIHMTWATFIGVILILGGIVKASMFCCKKKKK